MPPTPCGELHENFSGWGRGRGRGAGAECNVKQCPLVEGMEAP